MFTHNTPIRTNEDLQYVHDAPTVLIHPSVPTDKFYHLVLKDKVWRSWSGDGKYDDHSAKPFDIDIEGHASSIRDRMIIQDSNSLTKAPVAVILAMSKKKRTRKSYPFSLNLLYAIWRLLPKVKSKYKIYTFAPNVNGQAPSDKFNHSDRQLYEWATCKNKFMTVRTSMKTVDGAEYVMNGVGKFVTSHRQFVMSKNGMVCMHASKKNIGIFKGHQWELKISPGIDPVLMVAFMAIIDKMNDDKN
jgi:uncharacterized protein YxjI